MTEQPTTAAGRALLGDVTIYGPNGDEVRQTILDIEAEARQVGHQAGYLSRAEDERFQQQDASAALHALHAAYYAIPAGEPTTEQVIEKLPALYSAIQGVLDQTARIAGLLATVDHAEREGTTVHLATRPTCAEHIAAAAELCTCDSYPDVCPFHAAAPPSEKVGP